MPSSSRQRRRIAGSASMAIPSSVRTSALPELPDAERLPCLATGDAAGAATTTAVAVETFTVLAPSPPVPQVSSSDRRRIQGLPGGHPLADGRRRRRRARRRSPP